MSDPTPGNFPAWLYELEKNPVQPNPKMENGSTGDWNKRPKREK
jgi:hypothetical protein